MTRVAGDPARQLHAGEVHVWQADFSSSDELPAGAVDVLSTDERLRADRFVFWPDRRAFILRRAMMRQLLGRYLDTPPQELRFSYGPAGKPALTGDERWRRLRFNLTRSGPVVLCAIASDVEVGVDVERTSPEFPIGDLVNRYLSRREADAVHRSAPGSRFETFVTCWTRKEARLKAAGRGIGGVDLARMREEDRSSSRIHDLKTYARYRAALAADAPISVRGPFEWCENAYAS